jgi:cytochrome c553
MNTLKYFAFIALISAFLWASTTLAADKTAGEHLATNCIGCHGSIGHGGHADHNPAPNLYAQQPHYLINQLNAFKSGSRSNALMKAMASNLSDDDIKNLATYFSSTPTVKTETNVALAKVGQAKASMCLGCHGSTAEGNGQFPRLAGQRADYLVNQLTNFKAGLRKNGQMQAIANTLSEEDMQALAAYFSGL